MNEKLQRAFDGLSISQRQAVEWNEGPALVLAGPGVGKTTVLTIRLARILEESKGKSFRILALTFTTKAGDEMRTRVEELVPGLIDRTVIGTFHSFCAQILRQHGSHLGIGPHFTIYDQDSDREELLRDALREASKTDTTVSDRDTRWLKTIDRLRASLVSPEKTSQHFRDEAEGGHIAKVHKIYEDALRAGNILDFNGLVLNACRLAHGTPGIAARIRQSYPHWMIDEFQDTTPAQYRFIRFLAGDAFRNVFAVADDDQIIYQWNGASYRQLVAFREQFQPELFQLVENRRCPPDVVAAANNLIKRNSERTPSKAPLVATLPDEGSSITVKTLGNDLEEAAGIAAAIVAVGRDRWAATAVLGRTRALLSPVLDAFHRAGVKAAIVTRRERFLSPQFVWLQECLDQSLRPSDRQMFALMADAANRMAGKQLDVALLVAEAEASGRSYLEQWALAAKADGDAIVAKLSALAFDLVGSRSAWPKVVGQALNWLPETARSEEGITSDAAEDKNAWQEATRAIRAEKGDDPDLSELLQGIALRPKEPPMDPDTVRLLTIHSAKGLEFDHVWVVGMAESVLPAWQSLQPDAEPSALEEERRSCFVAITRTKKTLVLSRAEKYRGWDKAASRFLGEMGLIANPEDRK